MAGHAGPSRTATASRGADTRPAGRPGTPQPPRGGGGPNAHTAEDSAERNESGPDPDADAEGGHRRVLRRLSDRRGHVPRQALHLDRARTSPARLRPPGGGRPAQQARFPGICGEGADNPRPAQRRNCPLCDVAPPPPVAPHRWASSLPGRQQPGRLSGLAGVAARPRHAPPVQPAQRADRARSRPAPLHTDQRRRLQAWLRLGRCVRKGERGIAILAPVRAKQRDEHGDGRARRGRSSARSTRSTRYLVIRWSAVSGGRRAFERRRARRAAALGSPERPGGSRRWPNSRRLPRPA
jgi:hypothetical protein